MKLISLYRFSNFLFRYKIPVLPKLIYYLQYILFNSSIPSSVIIGKGTVFAYGGIGVVVHSRAVIGDNCLIGQGITVGGTHKSKKAPLIGNNVEINAGARILGDITIGNNVIVGANAVVIKDIPSNCVVAGVPGRIIKENINIEEYI